MTPSADERYEFDAVIEPADIGKGGAYVVFPYNIAEEFGKRRVSVYAVFDGEPYEGSIVNMGVKNADGTVCYIIGVRKDIRAKIGKQPGDSVHVLIRERHEAGSLCPRCQSCGMMFDSVHKQYIAKEKDGSDSIYCTYCYKDGAFIDPNAVMEDMIEMALPHITRKIGDARAAGVYITKVIRDLSRWKR